MLINEGYQQAPHVLPPAWDSDLPLKSLLRRILPSAVYAEVDDHLKGFQNRLAGPIHQLALLADGPAAEPTLTQYNQYGQRVDTLKTSEGWRGLKRVSAVEGLVAEGFERKHREFSRITSFAKGYLMVPEGRYVGCPLSMSDGAARVLELYGTDAMKKEIIPRLISRDPDVAWTAGQWMTEKPGGSDVSLTETIARPRNTAPNYVAQPGDEFILDGFKWFSSATDGDVALALARTGGAGSRGLSLFLIKLRDEQGNSNGVRVHRLKKKWGTKALPTAELELRACVGQLVGELGRGTPTIATVLNITRIHSALSGVAALRRALHLAKEFARVRHVGGEKGGLLIHNEMHTGALFPIEIVCRAALHFEFGLIALLGRDEALTDAKRTPEESLRLRILTPVVKAFNARITTQAFPETMQALGGQGFMEENEIGRLIQDSMVENIWEGTTQTLALDVVRVLERSKGMAAQAFTEWSKDIIKRVPSSLKIDTDSLAASLHTIASATTAYTYGGSPDPRLATVLLVLLGYTASAMYLLEQAIWSHRRAGEDGESDAVVVNHWIQVGSESRRQVAAIVQTERVGAASSRVMENRIVYGRDSKL